jgi:hypothetical protein
MKNTGAGSVIVQIGDSTSGQERRSGDRPFSIAQPENPRDRTAVSVW